MALRGIDYAWCGSVKPDPDDLKAAGVRFICRYLSNDPAKNLTGPEFATAVAAGLGVVVVWETTANRMLSGAAGGQADARAANGQANTLGMPGAVIYFACDWDATESQQAAINAYLDGAASVIGRPRTGMYAGYHPLRRAFDAGKITWGWQTYAWSGGNWDTRAQLRQVQNGVRVCGVDADWDEARVPDYGQWPRPGTNPYPTLWMPVTGPAVRTLQDRLNTHGANPQLTVDGVFGTITDNAVRWFQDRHGLTVDGIVGPATWAELRKDPDDWYYAAPAGLTATGGHTSVALAWHPPPLAGHPAPDHYLVWIYKGTSPTAGTLVPRTPPYPRPVFGTSEQFGGLTRSTVYTVHVSAAGPVVDGDDTRVGPGVFASAQFRTG